MKMLTRLFALAALLLLAPLTAQAQVVAQADNARPGILAAGAFAGVQFDTADDFLVFGGDARLAVPSWKIEVSPRFSYQPLADGHVVQIDVNVLKNYDLARPGKLRPYVGIGGAIRQTSIDPDISDTNVGLNLISGARLAMSAGSGYEPFLHAQYTMINDTANVFSIVVGVSFGLRR